jgi:hypothetical protein
MNKRLQALMGEQYNAGKLDLFAAFIIRCQELLAPQGLLGMLTMHSYMFISSYEDMRELLCGEVAIETLAHFGGGLFAVGNPGTLQTAAFVLRKEPNIQVREGGDGLYFRLVRERDAEGKRIAFEAALAALRAGQPHSQVFTYRQADFNAIPGKPWAYWASARIRQIFQSNPRIKGFAKPWVGIQTSDNPRFLRYWWEVGIERIARFCASSADANQKGLNWVPHMKGGAFRRWYGNQDYVIKWGSNGREMKAFAEILKTKVKSPPGNGPLRDFPYYFKQGVTWTHTSSIGLNARFLPAGFICNVEAMASHPASEQDAWYLLAILNSAFANHITNQLNPTIHFGSTEIGNIPLPTTRSAILETHAKQAIELAKTLSEESEREMDFLRPARSHAIQESREKALANIEALINEEVSSLFELTDADIALIRQDVEGPPVLPSTTEASESDEIDTNADDEEENTGGVWSEQKLGQAWISYALGTVLGRYKIGEANGLGRGDFDGATVAAIRGLIDPIGVMVAEKGHPQDIVSRTVECLEIMRGQETAHALIRAAASEDKGGPEDLLRSWLDRFAGQPLVSFWKHHLQIFRNRPIYWPLQSPKKYFTAWVLHERFGPTTLFTIKQLADDQRRLIERELPALALQAAKNRAAANKRDELLETIEDIQEFSNRIQTIANGNYTFCIDDGVLLNAAPLHPLLPSWPETKKAWKELEAEKHEWAQQAMKHWPDRVKEACKNNRSFAIAHGLA